MKLVQTSVDELALIVTQEVRKALELKEKFNPDHVLVLVFQGLAQDLLIQGLDHVPILDRNHPRGHVQNLDLELHHHLDDLALDQENQELQDRDQDQKVPQRI